MHLAVGILRLQNGLDYSHIIQLDEDGQINEQSMLNSTRTRNNSTESLPRNQSYTQMSQGKFIKISPIGMLYLMHVLVHS